MTYLDTIILGCLEGLTEFLPISSTGHLILASHLLGIAQSDFVKSFEIAIQLGSILAVAVIFWKSFTDISTLKRLLVAFLPTCAIGFVLYHFIKQYLIGNMVVVVIALIVGGFILIAVEHFHARKTHAETDSAKRPTEHISYKHAFLIGIAQAFAVIPGVSRSGATVVGGLLLGISRSAILTFSFLLAVPTMVAATGYDIIKNPQVFAPENLDLLLLGFITAFIVAVLVIRFALSFIKRHSFTAFGIYRIILGLVFVLFVL